VTGSITGRRLRRLGALVAVGVLATALTACGSDDDGSDDSASSGNGGGTTDDYEVKLGYFPNLTHASAIVGIDKGYLEDHISEDGGSLKVFDFNSGSDVIQQLQSGGLDASYIGPSPAITAYDADPSVRIVSGATSGGASLVVSKDITSPDDLEGKTIATPGPGNTQDVAAKFWLKEQGYDVSVEGKGDVTVINLDNSDTVTQFASGEIDGAWVPEPYASLLVAEGGTTLVDEADLWPNGQFVTTHLLVRQQFIDEHPELLDDLLEGQIESNDFIASNGDEAKQLVGAYITSKTGSEIPAAALDSAWSQLTFTNDPIADSLIKDASDAAEVGFYDPIDDLSGIYDLDPINKLLADAGEDQVSGPTS
jgi:NitT/TauT family transport system substrate-binding protein